MNPNPLSNYIELPFVIHDVSLWVHVDPVYHRFFLHIFYDTLDAWMIRGHLTHQHPTIDWDNKLWCASDETGPANVVKAAPGHPFQWHTWYYAVNLTTL